MKKIIILIILCIMLPISFFLEPKIKAYKIKKIQEELNQTIIVEVKQ